MELEIWKDKVEISHLHFANDTIPLLQDDDRLLRNTITLIQGFEYLI